MEPTFHPDQWLLVRRLNWPAPPLRKGEVIVFAHDRDWLVKRIAALPGEPFPASMAEIEMPDEPPSGQAQTPVDASASARDRVPSGSLFVLGDNLNNSEDSRTFGPIPMTSVLGRVLHWTRPPKRRLGADRASTGLQP
jgi:signal peptidase I